MKKNLLLKLAACVIMLTCIAPQLSAQAPTIAFFTPIDGRAGTLLTINGTNLSNATSIKVGAVEAVTVSNTGTKLVVMVMPGTATGKIRVTTTGGKTVSASNFSVIGSALQFKQQGPKIPDAGDFKALFGHTVAISADGNTAVIAGPGNNKKVGAVWVYIRTNAGWVQQAGLVGTGYFSNKDVEQGDGLAISADGNTVAVGGPSNHSQEGGIWVFTRNAAGVWSQQGGKLLGTGASTVALQGWSVALTPDGNTLVSGGWADGSTNYGSVWIFERNNGVWTQKGNKLEANAEPGIEVGIGWSVGISATGNTIVAGGFIHTPTGTYDSGAAWIFVRDTSGTWKQQGDKLIGDDMDGNTSAQGISVAISADGNTVISGGYRDSSSRGAAWVFARGADSIWKQQGKKLVGRGTPLSWFANAGWSVALTADGNTAVVGGYPGSVGDNQDQGFCVFKRTGDSTWTQQGAKMVGTGGTGTASQGYSVAISADGSTIVSGAPSDDGPNIFGGPGSAWIFVDSSYILPVTLTNFKAYPLGKGIQTAWTGVNEINMNGYDVERSANGRQFTALGNVPAQGVTAAENSYTYFDAAPLQGDNFYRIKAINKDGSYQYSSIVKVNIANTKTGIQIFPNPVSNKTINLQLNNVEAGNYSIVVYNAAGQRVYSRSITSTGGNTAVSIHLSGAAAGVYQVEMKGKKSYHTEALVQ